MVAERRERKPRDANGPSSAAAKLAERRGKKPRDANAPIATVRPAKPAERRGSKPRDANASSVAANLAKPAERRGRKPIDANAPSAAASLAKPNSKKVPIATGGGPVTRGQKKAPETKGQKKIASLPAVAEKTTSLPKESRHTKVVPVGRGQNAAARSEKALERNEKIVNSQAVSRGLKRRAVLRTVEEFPCIRMRTKTSTIKHLFKLEARMLHNAWREEQRIFRALAIENKPPEANAEDASTLLARTRGKRQRLEKNLQAEITRNEREHNQIEGDINELEEDIRGRTGGAKVVAAAHAAVAAMTAESGKKTTTPHHQSVMTPHPPVSAPAPARPAVNARPVNARPREKPQSDGATASAKASGAPQVHKYGTRSRGRAT